jgi:hypothetical protein
MTDATYLDRVNRGIAKANGAAPDKLKADADRILRHVLTMHRQAHSGLFWQYVNDYEPELYGLLRRHSYMVNGRWKLAAKEGLCRQTADRHPTWLVSAHQKNTVWESLIYQGNQ